jgi:3-hydroxymyristoyl/3-hydroxydecanoyl-(acyl carrier protein) dehydratase
MIELSSKYPAACGGVLYWAMNNKVEASEKCLINGIGLKFFCHFELKPLAPGIIGIDRLWNQCLLF